MPKKKKPIYNGIEYDSAEEIHFVYWLEEALSHNVIVKWEYQPKQFTLSEKQEFTYDKQLKTKISKQKKQLLSKMTYTPDFRIEFNSDYVSKLFECLDWSFENKDIPLIGSIYSEQNEPDKYVAWIDVKGLFNKHGYQGFLVKQHWMMAKFGLYINIIIPDSKISSKTGKTSKMGLFEKTWSPSKWLIHKRKFKFPIKTINSFIGKS